MRVIRLCAWAVLPALAGLVALSWHCESILFSPSEALYDQAADSESGGEAHAMQRLSQAPDFYRADYGFENFNGDLLHIGYQAPRQAYDSYCAGFWYSRAVLDTFSGPAIDSYLASRGFKRLSANVISADVPAMIRRSSGPLKALSSAFDRIAVQKGYDSENLIGAVAAMVQTAIRFQIPPLEVDGLRTGGILPPVMTFIRGWGNCDSKTGLMGAILANWPNMRMIGITPPGHYLMGVLRIPARGDAFVEYRGLQYVLVEPAGPAWLPPGTVGVDTLPELDAAAGFRIEPFFDES